MRIGQLTQASGVVVVRSGTEAVPAFADGLQGAILPRTIVMATQAFLLGYSWFGCGCGYWWRRGCGSCGSDYGGCESKPLNLKEKLVKLYITIKPPTRQYILKVVLNYSFTCMRGQ